MTIIEEAKALIDSGKASDTTGDFLADLIKAAQGDRDSIAKIIYTLARSPFLFHERIFWSKMERYLNGIYVSEEDRAMFRAKLVEDGSSDENAKRLIACIDRAETTRKIDFLINVTRCFLSDFIDRTTFFRICHAITETIDEDLIFIRDHIFEKQSFEYSDTIQGLFISGLVAFSALGGDSTQYAFTPLAEDVDRFAISYNDVGRYPNPIAGRMISSPKAEIPTASDDEVQEMLDSVFEKTKISKVNVEIPFGEF